MMHILTRTVSVAVLSVFLASAADKAGQIHELLSRYHSNRQFNGTAIVAEGGTVIYKKGFGYANFEWEVPNTPDTKFRLGSVTKQFTAAVVLQLVNEGKVRLDAKLSEYIPEYPKASADRVTIHQLLNHTSGIPNYTALPGFIRDKARDPITPAELLKEVWNLDLEFEPGTKFNYSNSGYNVLGAVIERVTGKSYADVLGERIFQPLKMTASGYDENKRLLARRAGAYQRTFDGFEHAAYIDMTVPYAGGALYSTVEDLFLWDQALYTDKVVPAKYRDLMFTPNLDNYGYGWTIRAVKVPGREQPVRTISHGGGVFGFSTFIERIPSDKHLVVLLNNTGGTVLSDMVQGIRSILYGAPVQMPKAPAGEALYRIVLEKGAAAAIAAAREWKTTASSEYDLNARELGGLSEQLLRTKRMAEAEEIAKLNTELYPNLGITHYALGEIYRHAGKRDLAIESYVRAQELNPGAAQVAERLKQLRK